MSRSVFRWTLSLVLVACSAEHYVQQGQAALYAHDLPEAEASFRRALQADQVDSDALVGLGWTYLLAGQRPAARDAFNRCVEVAPSRLDCRRGLANVALSDGNTTLARDILQAALKIDPHDAGVQSSQALLEMSTGDLTGAKDRYRRLVDRFPDRAEYRLGLGEVLLREHDPDGALAQVERALGAADTPARYVAQLHLLRARALVTATAGRVDADRCAETVPPVTAWLDAADRAVASAKATGVSLPDTPAVERLVLGRRASVEDACPGLAPSDGDGDPAPDQAVREASTGN